MTDTNTPMMLQYRRAKAELDKGTILFFRLGDFFEMFFDDALTAAPLLDVALTKRQGIPMCGVPFHAVNLYAAKLLKSGFKVALCDQLEDPKLTNKLVQRGITAVLTPGTLLEENMLQSQQANYLAGIHRAGGLCGLAFLELSTGEFWMEDAPSPAAICEDLALQAPAEVLVSESLAGDAAFMEGLRAALPACPVTVRDDWTFEPATADDGLCRHFGVSSLEGFGCAGHPAASGAAGALLHYVTQDLRRNADHVRRLQFRAPADAMILDESTLANLDLLKSRSGPRSDAPTSLLQALDETKTPMGSRLLRDWIVRPLRAREAIVDRLDAIEALLRDRHGLAAFRASLGPVRDIERLIARLSAGSGNARDLRALATSLAPLPTLRQALTDMAGIPAVPPAVAPESVPPPRPSRLLAALAADIHPQTELVELLDRALVDDPPIAIKEGGLIRAGYSLELDDLRSAATSGRQWIADMQAREIQRTGIKSLKIKHTGPFGYFIEVTKANLAQVPPDYERKQTLVTCERFVTPELKDYESRILNADERAIALETQLFLDLRARAAALADPIQSAARAIAAADVLAALSHVSATYRYVRPDIEDGGPIHIVDGRHPVVERMPESERFVPNDTLLDNDSNRLLIITGPNMAGKSTFIKQVALLVIMAHIGCFIPAKSARIALTDRVFTRVGAGDDIARGRSTFMVEMQETANILNNATAASLIVLDEIGRGTSTFDGISIAWSVAEYIHNVLRAKTLFATHYHELTDIALTLPGVKNYNILVSERGGHISFLRKIAPGAADKSYGIQVAHLAGLPRTVVQRAKEILANLEENELEPDASPRLARTNPRVRRPDPAAAVRQLALFDLEGANDTPPAKDEEA
ncbi:MAG: DNA mismatch repair protein MutS [Kiritimatiellae bacterium]|nr:DNA mismatch repair protein MutS [Kiritimatiellia bacterium]